MKSRVFDLAVTPDVEMDGTDFCYAWKELKFLAENNFAQPVKSGTKFWWNNTGHAHSSARKPSWRYGKGFKHGGEVNRELRKREPAIISQEQAGNDAERLAILRKFGGAYAPGDLVREDYARSRFRDKIEDPKTLQLIS